MNTRISLLTRNHKEVPVLIPAVFFAGFAIVSGILFAAATRMKHAWSALLFVLLGLVLRPQDNFVAAIIKNQAMNLNDEQSRTVTIISILGGTIVGFLLGRLLIKKR